MGKAKILIVEDERITALDLKEKLEDMGYTVLDMVSAGEDAVDVAVEIRPDLVLMDILLKGEMSGIEAAEKIGPLDIPIVYLTAFADEKTLKRALESAPYGYLVKPYKDKELEVTIETALKKHDKYREKLDQVKEGHFRKKSAFPELREDKQYEIMIVEDEFITALDLVERLEDMSYKVVAMESTGAEAIKKAWDIRPDLILLDIMLEGSVDGIKVADKIKYLEIPVIYLTAYADQETVKRALKTAPYGYLIKPFNDQELKTSLETALEKRRSEEQKKIDLYDKIVTKEKELKLEKTSIFFVTAIICSMAIYGIATRSMTWLMYLLFIPAIYNFGTTLISFMETDAVIPYENLPMVSIIIPAHNEENTIVDCVRSMAEQDYHQDGEIRYEILVINDGSTDNTAHLLEDLKTEIDCLRIVTRKPPRSGKGKGYVLNDGVQVANGEVIAVFDADAMVKKDFLKKCVPYLNGEKVAGVQARVRMYNREKNALTSMQHTEFAIFGNVVLRARDIMGKCGYLGGNGQLTLKSAVEEIGGWDGFAVTEDLNMSIKLILKGYKIRFCSDTSVWQEAIPEWRRFFRQRIRWATGNLETLFVYLVPIMNAKIPIYQKIDSVQYLFYLLFNAFVMLGYIVFILNLSGWMRFQFDVPILIGIISTFAFFPGVILGIKRDKTGILRTIFKSVEYWVYCLYLLPLFVATFFHMIMRKERRWAKTAHSGEVRNMTISETIKTKV